MLLVLAIGVGAGSLKRNVPKTDLPGVAEIEQNDDVNNFPDFTENLIGDLDEDDVETKSPTKEPPLTETPGSDTMDEDTTVSQSEAPTTHATEETTNTEENEDSTTPPPDNVVTQSTAAGLINREHLISALTKSFSSIIPNIEDEKQGMTNAKLSFLDSTGKSIKGSGLSGNEPKSGPSPDGFGPIDDIFLVKFPQPSNSGRDTFQLHSQQGLSSFNHFAEDDNKITSHHHPASSGRDNFTPLPPSLERGHVSRHFSEKDSINSKTFVDHHHDIDRMYK